MQDILVNTPCKVILEDFDYKKDLNLRLACEKLTHSEMAVLEEILYSPLKVSIEELCSNTDVDAAEMDEILNSLAPLNLFVRQSDKLLVDKETRKYLELVTEKFASDFSPNLDYYRELLKRVPIHCPVSWFHTPRTSNNIFNSILEKHFKTPRVYARYLKDTLSEEEELKALVSFVVEKHDGMVEATAIKEEFQLTDEELEEKILFLEYHYILISTYQEAGNGYTKYLSEYEEWNNWKNCSSHNCKSANIEDDGVEKAYGDEFSFIQDMSYILDTCNKTPLKVKFNQQEELFYLQEPLLNNEDLNCNNPHYLARVINKNLLLGLIVIEEDRLKQTSPAEKWLATPVKQRTLITFKHPHNSLSHKCDFSFHQHDRNIIEVQKALSNIPRGSWVLFDDFIDSHLRKTNSLKQAELKKVGRKWKYSAAEYDEKEVAFIKTVILDWLFESGMIVPGTYEGKECFKVTSLGYELYS